MTCSIGGLFAFLLRHAPSRQPTVLSRREKTHRFPPVLPGSAGATSLSNIVKLTLAPAGRVARGEARLMPTDDNHFTSSVFDQFRNEIRNPKLDIVTDGANRIDAVARGVIEFPVLISFAGKERAGITAAHGNDHV